MTTPGSRYLIVIAFIICMTVPVWGQQYLYTPQPASSEQKVPSQDGILVQEITVQKGDSLYRLSRHFSGHGMYFPQILLFNSIKNPNLIYPGDTLKVPVSKLEADHSEQPGAKPAGSSRKPDSSQNKKVSNHSVPQVNPPLPTASSAATDLSMSDLKSSKINRHKTKMTSTHKKKDQPVPSHTRAESSAKQPSGSKAVAGQKLFDAAARAYRSNDCRTALGLLDRYLTENPGSPLAADASLYKADCYMKMSAQ